jgi:four helix bundle protein
VRSNYRAARKGRSRAEFQAKLGTAAEEADECVDWLAYLRDARIRYDPLLFQEALEIAKILRNVSAICTCEYEPIEEATG